MHKIMVVDDNAISRKLLLALLNFEGYATAEASDGAEGLRVARREHPHLIISDILMPTMDGYEFVHQLRADTELASTAVIFYTANYHEREAKRLADSCGVIRVIVKPCDTGELMRSVAQVLSGTTVAEELLVVGEFDQEHLRVITNKLSEKANQLTTLNSSFAALIDLNVQLASERDPQLMIDRVCAGARNLIGSRYGVMAVLEKGGAQRVLFATSGIDFGTQPPPTPVINHGSLGLAYTEQRNWRETSAEALDTGLPLGYPAAYSIVAAPVCSLARNYGWICLVDKIGADQFDADDERMLTIIGAHVGRIYENGTLYLEVQEHAAQLRLEMDQRERAAEELRESEARFRQLAENIQDVFLVTSADLTRTLYVSPAYEEVWGRPCAEIHKKSWQSAIHPADRERVEREQEHIVREGVERGEMEFRIVRPDGHTRWVLTRTFPVMDDGGTVLRRVGIATDITARKQAEAKIVHLSRVHAMLSGINSLIVRVGNRDELLHEACRLAVEAGRFRTAWCAWLDRASGEVTPLAWAGELPELLQVSMAGMGEPEDDSLVNRALRSQRPEVCNELRNAQRVMPHQEELVAHGLRAMVTLPFVIAGKSVGCMVLITDEAGFFDEAETELLTELAGDISFALDYIEKAERLSYLAYYDALTGLANRTLFAERLALQVSAAIRGNRQLALVIVDPERFASFNDTMGRAAGDELLRQMAARLVECVGAADLVGRLGSDQFAAVIPDIGPETNVARTVEAWWRRWLGAPFMINGAELTLSAKAGIALYPTDGADADTLLRNAQAAVKKAKNVPARHVFYTSHLTELVAERLALENQMRRALENEEFVLHYQPKVDLERRMLTGVEALMRWQNPQLGLIAPLKFIPIMEENGLIVEVGAWALRQASRDRARWLELGLKAPRIAVNVSTIQLRHPDFVSTVAEVVASAGSDAGIDIEVTESLLVENVADNMEKLAALRKVGVQIALDDFGTGYSSLAYLTRLPLETLKIDRSFIILMLDDPSTMTLVSTIISLAHALKLDTVAEGVESEEQAKILRLLRCDQMQGYLMSKPLSFDDMTEYLLRDRA